MAPFSPARSKTVIEVVSSSSPVPVKVPVTVPVPGSLSLPLPSPLSPERETTHTKVSPEVVLSPPKSSPAPAASPKAVVVDAENEIESAVAKTLEKRRRLEALRQQLDAGIQNVVGNVSDSVAKTIASQRAFSAHSADQEYDEKVLLNTGTPDIATAPLDATDLPSIALLDRVADVHPELTQPIGENI